MILDQFGGPTGSTVKGLENWHFGTNNDFGRANTSVFSQFLPNTNEGQELPRPLDFERLTDEFYRRNAIVYSAVRQLSRSASEPVFQACTIDAKGVAIPDDALTDPLAKLIAQPNEEQECYEFMEQMIIHMQVTGNAFIEMTRSKSGSVVGLELLRPDLVTLVPMKNKNGKKIKNYFFGETGQKRSISAMNMIHMRLPDAFDEFWGLSPLFVLAKYGDIDTQATDFMRAYFLNRGVPSGMLMATGRIQDNDRQEMKDSWRQQLQGPNGWHGIPVFDQGVTYQALSTGLKDLDLNPIFNQTETRIAMVYGVPPILLGTNAGLERSTMANFAESRRSFWTETLVPMYTRIVRRLTKALAQVEFGPRRAIKADVSKVAGLQDNKEKRRTLALKGFDKGLFTVNEAREVMDMDPIENELIGDSIKMSTSTVMVPRDQATQFADLTGDVLTDVVQSEVIESEEGLIKGVGDPNPAIGEPDNPDPPSQKKLRLDKLADELKQLRKEIRDEAKDKKLVAGDASDQRHFVDRNNEDTDSSDRHNFEQLDHIAIIEDAIQGDQQALEDLLLLFPAEFRDELVAIVDRIVGAEIDVENGLNMLELSIGEELTTINAFFTLVCAMEEAGKTPDEIKSALMNAKSRLREED